MFTTATLLQKSYSNRRVAAWLWHTLWRHRLQALLNTLLGCSAVVLDFAFIAATKQTIDIATHRTTGDLRLWGGLLALLLAGQLLLGFGSKWVKALLGVKAQNRMQLHCFGHLLRSGWQERHKRHSGDLTNRLERDVRDVVDVTTETVPSMAAVSLRLVGAFAFLYAMDSTLALLMVAIAPLFILLSKVYMRRMRKLTREVRDTDSRIQSLMQESIQHQLVIRTLQQQDTMSQRLEDIQHTLRQLVRTRTVFSSGSSALIGAGFMTGYLVTFLWGANRLYEGTITYGMMTAFIQLVGQIQGPFRDLTRFVPVLVNAFTAGERLMQIEDMPLEEDGTPLDHHHEVPGVRLNGVTFRYTPQGRAVMDHFGHDFAPGSHTAIVGETGAGKTTLIRLLLALIRPDEGTVQVYNSSGSVPCSAVTRSCFTYVPQGNTLLSGSLRENLQLGDPTASDERMREALAMACADFALALPDGLDTRLGEQGMGLSEGQAQRIAIARALLRPCGILLLDEATSSLDYETEHLLWQRMSQSCQGKTLIYVTHRPDLLPAGTQILRIGQKQQPTC